MRTGGITVEIRKTGPILRSRQKADWSFFWQIRIFRIFFFGHGSYLKKTLCKLKCINNMNSTVIEP